MFCQVTLKSTNNNSHTKEDNNQTHYVLIDMPKNEITTKIGKFRLGCLLVDEKNNVLIKCETPPAGKKCIR